MKRKSRKKPVLAQLLFPETYAGAEDALMRHMPYLRLPEMRDLLIKKASFVTFLAIGATPESDWDIKEEQGEELVMYIAFSSDSTSPSDELTDEEIRIYSNYSFVTRMVEDYARAFGRPMKRLPYRK